jgi:protein-S-isoprenylcysteine O-methyltransferase Ste14
MKIIFAVFRTIVYASLFIAFVLIYVPARLLALNSIIHPVRIELLQIVAMIIGGAGAVLALWCVFSFAFVGKGTPAPFDPPRQLVMRGPYRFVRNPMYIGAVIALAGAALFYKSWLILVYTIIFFLVAHLFVIGYEEPGLRGKFDQAYENYCLQVNRWCPFIRQSAK